MRCTSPTPGKTSMSRTSNSRRAPTAPSTVCRSPVERCTSNPRPIRRSITCCICSSDAASCMATIMVFFLIQIEFRPQSGWLFFRDDLLLLYIPHYVNDALVHLAQIAVRQRAMVRFAHILKDDPFTVGFV